MFSGAWATDTNPMATTNKRGPLTGGPFDCHNASLRLLVCLQVHQ